MTIETLADQNPGSNILVVDDNPRNLALLEDILGQAGYTVRPAITGELALLSAKTKLPDLVLLDIRLPDIDGYEICKELKSDPGSADIPVIFISALDDPLDKVRAFAEGGIDYIAKPFQAEEVVARIRTHLALRRMQLELTARNRQLQEEIERRQSAQQLLQDAHDQLECRVQQRTAELARALEERSLLATAVEQAAESIIITDEQARILYVNPFFEERTGYRRQEVVGQTPKFLQSGSHDSRFYDQLRRTLAEGRNWQGRFTNRCKDGSLLEEDAVISPVFDENGRTTNYIAVKRDITRTLQMERQLQHARKMEAIGTLAGGIAHDFNNILGAIIGCAEIAMAELGEGDRARQDLQRVLSAGQRARSLVQQILAFSRQSENSRRPLRLQPIIKETVGFLRASLPASIEIVTRLDDAGWLVLADPVQIQQILLNLCANAAHAMAGKGGELSISLSARTIDQSEAEAIGGMQAGDFLQLVVRDSGHGISPVIVDRIFDPFFTTKAVGEGTGLGLSVVHGIIGDLGGRVVVDSETDKGTTFSIYLIREKEALAESNPPPATPHGSGKERVLLVEDEEYPVDTMQRKPSRRKR
jgi:PAS domain S-box-containing protein